jgi:hypothetical protein
MRARRGRERTRARVGGHLDCGGEEGLGSGGRALGGEALDDRGGEALGDADHPANKAHNEARK